MAELPLVIEAITQPNNPKEYKISHFLRRLNLAKFSLLLEFNDIRRRILVTHQSKKIPKYTANAMNPESTAGTVVAAHASAMYDITRKNTVGNNENPSISEIS